MSLFMHVLSVYVCIYQIYNIWRVLRITERGVRGVCTDLN